jgi:hypothetical protein
VHLDCVSAIDSVLDIAGMMELWVWLKRWTVQLEASVVPIRGRSRASCSCCGWEKRFLMLPHRS